MTTPFAVLGLRTNGVALTALTYLPLSERTAAPADRVAEKAVRELESYLADPGYRFTVALAPSGTAFQQRVWTALSDIPRGQSLTYGEVARRVHSVPRAGKARANPIALIVPPSRHRRRARPAAYERGEAALAIWRWLLAHEGSTGA
jgi:methylated-DNA-[protein]-cysteine S-methyltransferase